jgi:hypothetical protein
LILDIEALIWKAVTKISRGEATATDALQLLIASLPQRQIEDLNLDNPVRTWFRPKNTNAANLTIDTHQRNAEGATDNAPNEDRRNSNAEKDGARQPRNKKPGHSIFSPTINIEGPTTIKPKRGGKANRLTLLIPGNLRLSTLLDEQLIVSADEIFIQRALH